MVRVNDPGRILHLGDGSGAEMEVDPGKERLPGGAVCVVAICRFSTRVLLTSPMNSGCDEENARSFIMPVSSRGASASGWIDRSMPVCGLCVEDGDESPSHLQLNGSDLERRATQPRDPGQPI